MPARPPPPPPSLAIAPRVAIAGLLLHAGLSLALCAYLGFAPLPSALAVLSLAAAAVASVALLSSLATARRENRSAAALSDQLIEDLRNNERTLQRLVSIATFGNLPTEKRLRIALQDICRYLGLDTGMLIAPSQTRRGPTLNARCFELEPRHSPAERAWFRDTFSDFAQRTGKTTDAASLDAPRDDTERALRERGAQAYIVSPLKRSGQIVGSVSFFSSRPRPQPFTRFERRIVEIAAAWMEGLLAEEAHLAAVQKSEERFQIAMSGSSVGLWDWEAGPNEAYWSPRIYEILGRDPKRFTPSYAKFLAIVHPDDRPLVLDAVAAMSSNRAGYDEEFRCRHADGRIVWVHAKGQGLWDPRGRIKRFAGSFEDITRRKEIEVALRLSEERLQLAIEGAEVGIWDWPDVTSDQIWWADKTYELLGYKPGEIQPTIGLFQELLHPDDSDRVIDSLRGLSQKKMSRQSEYRLRAKSGEYRWFLSSSVATLSHDVSATRVIGALQDIHARRATDELLRRANDELRSKTEEMEQILYIVSHDLKSPLVTIHGFAHLLGDSAREGFRDEDPLPSIERITRAARHMGALIEDILQFSRIGRVADETEEVDLASVIDEQRLAFDDETRKANCEWEVRGPLPVLRANRTRLTQVMQNLIGNALKYGCDKEANRIVIGFEMDAAERCQLYVQDFGPGIHPDNQSRVFALFQRLEKRKPGTGLGLAIVKRVMDLYHGDARLESQPGQGCKFILEFPQAMLAPLHR